MAGVLPGVESARIRRFHPSNLHNGGGGGGGSSTRRSSFCLYASNHQEFHASSPFSMKQERNYISPAVCDDEKLDAAAREAKKRLDHKLQTHSKSKYQKEIERTRKINLCG